MKRVILLFAITLAVGVTVWAQTKPNPTSPPTITKPSEVPNAPAAGLGQTGIVDLNAVPALSTEARYSAGIFGSLGDDFIDPRFHDTEIDTFIFVGGNFSTNRSNSSGSNEVNFGFARNFGPFYLAAYYGGTLVEAGSAFNDIYLPGNLPAYSWSESKWNSNLAVLLGIAGMGFRIDAKAQSEIEKAGFDESGIDSVFKETKTESSLVGGPSVAVSWGAGFGSLSPWFRAGYRFSDLYVLQREATEFRYEEKFTGDSKLEVSGGADYSLGETSSVGGELRFGKTFPDREVYTGVTPIDDNPPRDPEFPFSNRRFGMMGFGAGAYYKQTFESGNVAFGFQPKLNAALTMKSNDWIGGSFTWTQPGDRWFTLDGSVNLGASIRRSEKLVFYTGVEVKLFDWTTWTQTGGDEMNPARNSSSNFEGIKVDNLQIGLTYALLENVDVGLGVSDILNSGFFIQRIPTIDLTVSTRLGGR